MTTENFTLAAPDAILQAIPQAPPQARARRPGGFLQQTAEIPVGDPPPGLDAPALLEHPGEKAQRPGEALEMGGEGPGGVGGDREEARELTGHDERQEARHERRGQVLYEQAQAVSGAEPGGGGAPLPARAGA